MAFEKKNTIIGSKKLLRASNGKFVRYEETENLPGLKMFVTIVPIGQGTAIMKMLESCGVNYNVIVHGEGTGKQFIPNLISENKKSIIFSFVREDLAPGVVKTLKNRLSTSKASNGISFSIKFTSVMGVSIYKFLANSRKVTGK